MPANMPTQLPNQTTAFLANARAMFTALRASRVTSFNVGKAEAEHTDPPPSWNPLDWPAELRNDPRDLTNRIAQFPGNTGFAGYGAVGNTDGFLSYDDAAALTAALVTGWALGAENAT